jgi:tetratricopeptide (TPR) repeat protein
VPDFSEAWNKRATVRFMIGNHDGSANDIAKVLQLEPRHFGALSGLGMIHMRAGNWESALKSYKAAFAIHPYLNNIETLIDDLSQRLKGQAL